MHRSILGMNLGLIALCGCLGKPSRASAPESATQLLVKNGRPTMEISNFETDLTSNFGQNWSGFDDKSFGGRSSVTVQLIPGGAQGSKQAVKVTGNVQVGDFPFPMSGLFLPLGRLVKQVPLPIDISSFNGVQFWTKGDGKEYQLRFQEHDITDFNFHHFRFSPGRDWQLIRVPFSKLVQLNWGAQVPWSGKLVSAFLIHNFSAPGEDFGSFEFYVDEISFF